MEKDVEMVPRWLASFKNTIRTQRVSSMNEKVLTKYIVD